MNDDDLPFEEDYDVLPSTSAKKLADEDDPYADEDGEDDLSMLGFHDIDDDLIEEE